jgi:polyisoprenoid-binding protein YceI
VLETDQFPEATFVLTEPIDLDTPPVEGAEVFAPATGDLTIHGVTNEVTFQLTARWDGDTIDVAGSAPVVFADFDVTPPDRPSVAVDDEGTIELQLTFVRA